MPTPLIHMTAAYSNAVLVAILPQVSDTAKNLELPIQQPITCEQVAHFNVCPYKDYIGGALWLTNGYWFVYSFGCVDSFRSPDNWFTMQDIEGANRFVGKDHMTTNEAVDFARKYFVKLGYAPETFRLNEKPTKIEGSYDVKQLGHIPFCRIVWESPEARTVEERTNSYSVRFDVDLDKKQIVGMSLVGSKLWRQNPTIDVVPETEIEYRRKQQSKVTFSTNAPKSILKKPATPIKQSNTNTIKLDVRQ